MSAGTKSGAPSTASSPSNSAKRATAGWRTVSVTVPFGAVVPLASSSSDEQTSEPAGQARTSAPDTGAPVMVLLHWVQSIVSAGKESGQLKAPTQEKSRPSSQSQVQWSLEHLSRTFWGTLTPVKSPP